jgi:hypothetical protein
VMEVNDVEQRHVSVEARPAGNPPLELTRLAHEMLANGRAARAACFSQRVRKLLARRRTTRGLLAR